MKIVFDLQLPHDRIPEVNLNLAASILSYLQVAHLQLCDLVADALEEDRKQVYERYSKPFFEAHETLKLELLARYGESPEAI